MNPQDIDVEIVYFLRLLKKLGLLSSKTYLRIGQDLMINGKSYKNAWRMKNWKLFLGSG